MILRIDDTDAARTEARAETGIVGDLEWLRLTWEEGPIRQSERGDVYRAAIERLRASGAVYPAYETEEELEALRELAAAPGAEAAPEGEGEEPAPPPQGEAESSD